MQYRVRTTCYYQQRFFEKGEVVELGDDGNVPEHFEALKTEEPKEPKKVTAKKPKK